MDIFSTAILMKFLVIIMTSVFFESTALELKIKPLGDKFIKPLGTSIVFTCEVIGSAESNIRIHWYDKDKREIIDNSGNRIYVEKDGAKIKKLYITQIENKDAGKYSCSAFVGGTKLPDKPVELSLFKDITFDHAPSPQHPEINRDTLIQCRVSAEPKADVSWRFNGQRIEYGNRYKLEATGLRIRNITQADNGNYTCRAEVESDGRYDEKRLTVIVHIPPKIEVGPGKVEGIHGQSVTTLTCKATGLPDPKYEFYKDNKKLLVSTGDRIQVDSDLGKLRFQPVQKDDEGQYTCKARNDVGEASSVGNIRVLVQPNIYELKEITTSENYVATLICLSHGDPAPNMTFRRIGNNQDYSIGPNENGRFTITQKVGRLELTIKKVGPTDTGNYTCKSRNSAGYHDKTGSINVNYRPHFPPNLNKHVYSWAGKTLNISCSAYAQPTPIFEWLRFRKPIPNNDTFQVFGSEKYSNLQVRVMETYQSWVYGEYTCLAKNTLGSTEFKIELIRATVPDEPRAIVVKEHSPNIVIFKIEPPKENGGMDVVGYRIEYENKVQDFATGYFQTDKSTKYSKLNITTDEEIRIVNLKPRTTYVFQIRAKNEVGVGKPLAYTVTTDDVRKPYPIVINSPKIGEHPYEYTIHWENPNTGGEPIHEYIIKYRKVKVVDKTFKYQEDWNKIEKSDEKTTPIVEYHLTGLIPLHYYQVEIEVKNNRGQSVPSDEFIFKTADVARLGEVSTACSSQIGTALLASVVAVSTLVFS